MDTDEALLLTVGRRIRDARRKSQLTQEEAAGAAGIDWRRWQRIEQGEVNATLRTLNRIATALGVDIWTLLAPK